MSWVYRDAISDERLQGLGSACEHSRYGSCMYCGASKLQLFEDYLLDDESLYGRGGPEVFRRLSRCCVCGWWHVEKILAPDELGQDYEGFAACGQLKNLDLSNISVPAEEVRNYLAAKYRTRFDVNPQLYEETVASVFASVGYRTRTTARSGDWGVDVFLECPNGTIIGVQVKRWKNAIEVEQITALTGALIINGCTRGMFVTTSRFTRGAMEAARRSGSRGFPIELVDAERFYTLLEIAQASVNVRGNDPTMPWNIVNPAFHAWYDSHVWR